MPSRRLEQRDRRLDSQGRLDVTGSDPTPFRNGLPGQDAIPRVRPEDRRTGKGKDQGVHPGKDGKNRGEAHPGKGGSAGSDGHKGKRKPRLWAGFDGDSRGTGKRPHSPDYDVPLHGGKGKARRVAPFGRDYNEDCLGSKGSKGSTGSRARSSGKGSGAKDAGRPARVASQGANLQPGTYRRPPGGSRGPSSSRRRRETSSENESEQRPPVRASPCTLR